MANQCWSKDFMSDTLRDDLRFRALNVLEDFNWEILAIEVDLNLPPAAVVQVLNRIAEQKGYPDKIRCDNGLAFVSIALAGWAENHGVHLDFIQPGKPTQNSYVERFNRTYRDEILALYLFSSLSEVRDLTNEWMRKYNEQRPNDSRGGLTPVEYLVAAKSAELSALSPLF